MKKPITDEKFYITDIPKDREKVKELVKFLGVSDLFNDEVIDSFMRCDYPVLNKNETNIHWSFMGVPSYYHTVITYNDLMANYLPKDTVLNEIVDEALKEVAKNEDKPNKVKNPNATHYEIWNGFEAIDIIKNILSKDEYIGYLKGNILKYQLRLGKKDNVEKEKEKIKDYQNELNELLGDINVQ
ncbi:DUF3310 domain-containing protein [Aliarcobacter butzleri]